MQTKTSTDTTKRENKQRLMITVDGNEACAQVAYKCNELIAIYPITPSSSMAELADGWAASGKENIFGTVPFIQEMQSEGGAAGAAHGALMTGALTTSFTASQGLLLMIPNMFKIAGELTSAVLHVSARAVATHGLSIFCDHSDVMATRTTGWSLLFANSVQEAHDFALIAQAATLKSRVPIIHAFDGFRTSHEVSKIELLSDDDMRTMISSELVAKHRQRGLSPESPSIKGTAQNPDVFFQSRERCNQYYDKAADIIAETMDEFAELTGRSYKPFEYFGSPRAERVVIAMGSATATLRASADYLNAKGETVGVLAVHLYRPFSKKHFLQALPSSCKVIAVLDRTKEPGAPGEPLLQDVLSTLYEENRHIKVLGGRYGLGSKEFTPAMARAVFDETSKTSPLTRFTVGITDDVTGLSLDYDESFELPSECVQAIFWGLGSDGTVGANKNSIKIIGEQTSNYAQGYFVYDSKKSGSMTVSHLRFGPNNIDSPYLIKSPNFIGIHQFGFIGRYPVFEGAAHGATVLINSPYSGPETWQKLPEEIQEFIRSKDLKIYLLDAYKIAQELKLGNRINTIMQVGFFALSGVLERENAIEHIKKAIIKTYSKFGDAVVKQNFAAVDSALKNLFEFKIPAERSESSQTAELACSDSKNQGLACARSHGTGTEQDCCRSKGAAKQACDKIKQCHCGETCGNGLNKKTVMEMIAGRGDDLPVSALPADGAYPTDTARLEKRNIATSLPVWDPNVCIQCGKCVMVCPHAVIRSKLIPQEALSAAPDGFKYQASSWKELREHKFSIQISAEDCTGCALCVEVCPAKNKSQSGLKAINMAEKTSLCLDDAKENWEYFLSLPELENGISFNSVKNMQLKRPLFEFSGACAGCGETPYLKLMSQLFGDRAVIANATGCSSIYGGNLPTTPWAKNSNGHGPAWANSLFEDNAEFGLGMRLAINVQGKQARRLLQELEQQLNQGLCQSILLSDQRDDHEIQQQRTRVAALKADLEKMADPKAKQLLAVADMLIRKSVWLIGGDGWAYDIGYGGLDHVLASGQDVNILVLDTEVYSNTGGQMSKSTARGAVAKFAAGGKGSAKKDLGRLAMSYGNVYVAQVAMGASDTQTVNAFIEAESYNGPSLIIAYSHCIAHGIDMSKGMQQQKLAVASGHWPLYRYDPRLASRNEQAFHLDSNQANVPLEDYYYSEARYRMLKQMNPEAAKILLKEAKEDIAAKWGLLSTMLENSKQESSECKQNPQCVKEQCHGNS